MSVTIVESTTKPGQRPYVGRARERELLVSRLAEARSGAGGVVLLVGEPGAGKTRLAEELLTLARTSGVRSGWGRATEHEGSPPYWPFYQLLRNLHRAGYLSGEALEVLAESPGDGSSVATAETRFRRFEAVVEVLTECAEPDGLAVVLDDMHWSDSASLQLLAYVGRSLAQTRVLLLVAYRDTEGVGQDPLRAALASLVQDAAVSRVRLGGLSESEVAEQLSSITGWEVPESVAAAVYRRTQGNPFFVEELGRLLVEPRDGELPDGVRDAVRVRLARLTERCRAVISAASVLGSDIDVTALTSVVQQPLDVVIAAIDEAAAAGIVTFTPTPRFTHDLVRESARSDVATAQRMRLHQRFGEHLMSGGRNRQRIAEIAFHLLESLPLGDARRAVEWTERAADAALIQLAWEEAGALYSRALAVDGLDSGTRGRLLLGRARAQIRAYDVDGAKRSLIEAADHARELGDGSMLAEAVLVMEGVTDFLWNPAGRALCEEALAGLPEGDSALRARLMAQLVVADSWQSFEVATPVADAALAMAERVGDRHAIVETLRASQIVNSAPEGARTRLGLGDRLLAFGRDGDADAELWGLLWRFDAHAQLGEIGNAEADLGAIARVANRLRSPLARWHAMRCQAAIALARGRLDDALRFGRQSEGLARQAHHEGGLVPSLGFLSIVHGLSGEPFAIDDDVQSVYTSSSSANASLRSTRAWLTMLIGNREEALRLYRQLPPIDSLPPFIRLSALAGAAELSAAFDDRKTAAEVYQRLLPYADLFVCGGAGVIAILGPAQTPLGLTAATLGRRDDAVRHFRSSIERSVRAGMPMSAERARFQLAKVLADRRRPGDRDEAAALVRSAHAGAERLGMRPLQREAKELRDRLAGSRPGQLTAREHEIAGLVAEGLTNRQIAASLHISERTAETHVQHIFTKLGFATRAQIASWVTAAQVRTPPT